MDIPTPAALRKALLDVEDREKAIEAAYRQSTQTKIVAGA
jgi:hypothetical protein